MINIKTVTMFAIMAILVGSLVPSSAYAMTAADETTLARLNTVSSAADLPVNVAGPSAGTVDLELQLLMDVSGSVDDSEFLLQRTGYSDAFRDPDTLSRILGCGDGTIAVQLIYWAGASEQQIAVDWTEISDSTTANAFADAIDAAARPGFLVGSTAPGSAINYGYPLIFSNGFTSTRQVIDVSGDGAENDGDDTSDARNAALGAGVDVINGVVILGELGLQDFYTNNVIGGTGAFVDTAATFADFGTAIKEKLGKESCVVGGESLTINSASLFVAGLSANAVWIIPTLVGLAGTGIYFIRSRTNSEEI